VSDAVGPDLSKSDELAVMGYETTRGQQSPAGFEPEIDTSVEDDINHSVKILLSE
jgi:hypothetical protein